MSPKIKGPSGIFFPNIPLHREDIILYIWNLDFKEYQSDTNIRDILHKSTLEWPENYNFSASHELIPEKPVQYLFFDRRAQAVRGVGSLFDNTGGESSAAFAFGQLHPLHFLAIESSHRDQSNLTLFARQGDK